MKNKLFLAIFGALILLLVSVPVSAKDDKVDILVKYSNRDVAVTQIVNAGGKVKIKYKNFPMLSAKVNKHRLEQLLDHPSILKVELDGIAELVDEELDNSWGVKQVGAGILHEQGITGQGVKVAVLDTGLDYNNPEFADVYMGGWDFVNNDNDPMDDHFHGTFVSGIIAAADNDIGVVGGAPGVELYICKVLGAGGSGMYSTIIAAVDWCIDNGIDITNNSYGGSSYNSLMEEVFQISYDLGILHIASAGNSYGTPPADTTKFPARFPSVVAVAATDINKVKAPFSSVGPATELSAPGVDVLSWGLDNTLITKSGTSASGPHVVSTAAQAESVHLDWDNDTVRGQLRASAEDLGDPGHDWLYGFGLINAVIACGDLIPNPPPMPPLPPVPIPPEVITDYVVIHEDGETVTFHGTLIDLGNSEFVEAHFMYGMIEWGYTLPTDSIVMTEPGEYEITKKLQSGYDYRWTTRAIGENGKRAYGDYKTFSLKEPLPPVALTIQIVGNGSTDPTEGVHEYPQDLVVDVTAVPDEGWQFDSWTGDVADPNSANTTVTMDSSKTVIANFSQVPPPTTMIVSDYSASSDIRKTVTLQALVLDDTGQPVENARVTIRGVRINKRGKFINPISLSGYTDSSGVLVINRSVKFGTWQFTIKSVTKVGYEWEEQNLVRIVVVGK